MTLFPALDARDYVEEILAETMNINADGEYIERSKGTYNAVCNRCLRIMANHLNRPDLLVHVRNNLDMMAHLFHTDWTIETQMSNRQDRGERKVPNVAASYFNMAQRDGNSEWAAIADNLISKVGSSSWLLYPYLAHPDYRTESVAHKEPLDVYRKIFPVAKILRFRNGPLSTTTFGENESPFKAVYGSVELKAFRYGATYPGAQAFSADTFEPAPDGVRLTHLGANKDIPGYDLPIGRSVSYDEWRELRPNRDRWDQPTFDISLEITETETGFDFHIQTKGGIPDVTFWAEWCFDGPGQWESDTMSMDVENGQSILLQTGSGVFHKGTSGIRIGPGIAEHRLRNLRQETDSFRVQMAFKSPVDHTFELRYGRWSTGTFDLVQDRS